MVAAARLFIYVSGAVLSEVLAGESPSNTAEFVLPTCNDREHFYFMSENGNMFLCDDYSEGIWESNTWLKHSSSSYTYCREDGAWSRCHECLKCIQPYAPPCKPLAEKRSSIQCAWYLENAPECGFMDFTGQRAADFCPQCAQCVSSPRSHEFPRSLEMPVCHDRDQYFNFNFNNGDMKVCSDYSASAWNNKIEWASRCDEDGASVSCNECFQCIQPGAAPCHPVTDRVSSVECGFYLQHPTECGHVDAAGQRASDFCAECARCTNSNFEQDDEPVFNCEAITNKKGKKRGKARDKKIVVCSACQNLDCSVKSNKRKCRKCVKLGYIPSTSGRP